MKVNVLLFLSFLSITLTLFHTKVFGQVNPTYFNKTKVGFLPGIDKQPNAGFKQRGTEITTVNGVKLNSQVAIGIGVGIAAYVNPTITTIPIFGSIDFALTEKRSTPYFYGNFGYSLATEKSVRGGFTGEAGAGWKFSLGKKVSLGPEIGYRYQSLKYDFVNASGRVNEGLNSLFMGVAVDF